MYHVRFKGTHFEAGLKWGAALGKRGNFILSRVPFPVTEERRQFADRCAPIYRRYCPEIVQEVEGIARGQGCSAEELQAVLFSMYAMPPGPCCSCFAVTNESGIIFGRNSDFLPELEKLNMNVIYSLSGGALGFTGNTTAFVEMEDGVNESGLAAGLTSVYPGKVQPGLNAGIILRLILEKCPDVPSAIALIQTLPISSAQTFTLADTGGNIALVECCSEKTVVYRAGYGFVCAVNSFCLDEMEKFKVQGIDDWNARERHEVMSRYLGAHWRELSINKAEKLLAGEFGFMFQYDRKTGKDTVWSTVFDLGKRDIYRAEGNPSRRKYQKDGRFAF